VGEARWDVCMMHTKVLRREGEQEKNDRGREKAKEVRERGRLEGEGRKREKDGGTREKQTEGQERERGTSERDKREREGRKIGGAEREGRARGQEVGHDTHTHTHVHAQIYLPTQTYKRTCMHARA
jgi:hypothetical protein